MSSIPATVPATPPAAYSGAAPVLARGVLLRSALVVALVDAAAPRTVRQLVDALEDLGLGLVGKPSKVVSDALRWEVQLGRVHRVGWGLHRAGVVPRTTLWRMRRRIDAALAGRALAHHVHDSESRSKAERPALVLDAASPSAGSRSAGQPRLPSRP